MPTRTLKSVQEIVRPTQRQESLDAPLYNNATDYTIYLTPEKYRLMRKRCSSDRTKLVGSENIRGRILACKCFNGELISVTIRLEKRPQTNNQLFGSALDGRQTDWARTKDARVHKQIYERLGFRYGAGDGLIVVAGRTGSAKSTTARALAYEILKSITDKRNRRSTRRPHLVTLEDPIEKRFFSKDQLLDEANRPIDYTPRNKGRDYKSLSVALNDAKRQMPTVVYVGEVRTDKDWRAVVDFAGTGHLIVTTAHSGSVTETFSQIFQAFGAKTPADQWVAGHRVLGIVHQGFLHSKRTKALVPALWRRTPAGLAALLADGLSSVLPQFPSDKDVEVAGSYGRRWLLRRIYGEDSKEVSDLDAEAFHRDLEGM